MRFEVVMTVNIMTSWMWHDVDYILKMEVTGTTITFTYVYWVSGVTSENTSIMISSMFFGHPAIHDVSTNMNLKLLHLFL
jgi:hypothetical protein